MCSFLKMVACEISLKLFCATGSYENDVEIEFIDDDKQKTKIKRKTHKNTKKRRK